MLLQLVVLALILGVFGYKRYRRMTLLERYGFKGPKPNWLLGNFREAFGGNNVNEYEKWFKKYGDIVAFYQGGKYTQVKIYLT